MILLTNLFSSFCVLLLCVLGAAIHIVFTMQSDHHDCSVEVEGPSAGSGITPDGSSSVVCVSTDNEAAVGDTHIDDVPVCSVDCHSLGVSSVTISGSPENSNSSLEHSGSRSTRFVLRIDPPSSRSTKSSPVWDYFWHFDLN